MSILGQLSMKVGIALFPLTVLGRPVMKSMLKSSRGCLGRGRACKGSGPGLSPLQR